MANKKLNQLVTKPLIASGDLFPIADATTGQLYKTTISDLGTAIGSGVSSVNGLVGAVVLDTDDIQELASPVNKWFTDLRARAAISVSSPLAYNSGTGLITIAQATGSTNGYLSSTDWTTFNSKQAALSGTGFVKISGTTISYDNNTYLTTSAAATNYVPYTGATANVNLGLNYSLTAALIIKSGGTSTQFLKADGSIDTNTYLTTGSAASTYLPLSGGTISGDLTISSTNPRIYLTDTDNNPDYFISNTDGTFTIYDVTSSVSRFTLNGTTGTFGGNLTVGSIIKSGGTSSQFLKADGSVDSNSYALTSQLHNAVTIGTANGLTLSTQVLSLGLASSTANGALSSTDWTTFNNKQNALTNPVTGTGTSGIVAVFNGTSSITDSTIYANSTRVSIGADVTTTNRFTAVSSTTSAYAIVAQASSAAHGIWSNILGTGEIFRGQTAGGSYFIINNGGNAFLNGNLNVGDFASTSYRLNVVGTANITGALSGTTISTSGSATFGSDVFTYANGGIFFNGGGSYGSGIFQQSGGTLALQTGGSPRLTITNTGAATFSSSVTAGGSITSNVTSGNAFLANATTGTNDVRVRLNNTTGSSYFGIDNSTGTVFNAGAYATNIYTDNATPIAFSTNQSLRMIITSAGNVGIGTTSPTTKFYVSGGDSTFDATGGNANIVLNKSASYDASLYFLTAGAYKWVQSTNGDNLTFNSLVGGLNERMRITSSGNVGIGTTSPSEKLSLSGSTSNILGLSLEPAGWNGVKHRFVVPISGDNSILSFNYNGSTVDYASYSSSAITLSQGLLTFGTGGVGAIPTERMRITSGGNALFGTTGTSWQTTAGTYIFFQSALNTTRDGAEAMNLNRLTSNGDLVKFYQGGTNVGSISVTSVMTSYNVTSDYRLKEDLKPINGLDIVNKIKVYDYKWKADNSRMDGVLAHELQEVLPYAVTGVKDGEQMQSVDYSKIVPVLIQAIKDQQVQIEQLKNK